MSHLQESGSEIDRESDALRDKESGGRQRYALPDPFPIAAYLSGNPRTWKDVGKPNIENVINLHYDYNRWVRQDVFDSADNSTVRHLTYVVTPEKKCWKRLTGRSHLTNLGLRVISARRLLEDKVAGHTASAP
jgi:hypothetical protein